MFPLVIAIILTSIYLSVKPEPNLIKQFFGIIFVSQIFNFDLVAVSICGVLGTLTSILANLMLLSFMPKVIHTRDVSGFNMTMTYVNIINFTIWETYAAIRGDPFMTLS